MVYQICKMIGEMAVAFCGKVDGTVLIGGLVRFNDISRGCSVEDIVNTIAATAVQADR